jgi:hypothetical protein
MSLTEILKLLSKKNIMPQDAVERNSLLRSFGFDCIRTFQQLDNLIAMLFLEKVYLIAPWTIKVRYADPVFKVALCDIYFEPIETVVPMWLCVDSIIEAGKAPLFSVDNKEIQDMAFITLQQESDILSCMFYPTVKDENNEMYYPELSFHIQYVLDVIYGIRGYDSPKGLLYVATDLKLADKWRLAICAEGKRKMKKLVGTQRYTMFVAGIDNLNTVRKETSPVFAEEREKSSNSLTALMAKL